MKIAFYLCTSNTFKGVARSFKDFPPAHDAHGKPNKTTEDTEPHPSRYDRKGRTSKPLNHTIMKAFYFLSAVCELGIGDGIYIPFGTIPNGSDIVAVYSDSDDGRDLIAKIKDTPVACVQTENQFIFIYEME